MRKRLIPKLLQDPQPDNLIWLDLEDLVEVELTSEDTEHPIESALLPGINTGWRAAVPGKQTIRLLFQEPQKIRKIQLSFVESSAERTQEYTLRWSPDSGQSFRELVRQQWNFSPEGSTYEIEEHEVDLAGVTILELTIIPDISGASAVASLAKLWIA